MENDKTTTEGQGTHNNLSSDTIRALRFPLAAMVVFIHSFGTPADVDTMSMDYCHLGWGDIYNLLRVSVSHVIASCAVPIFFLISGYLFFSGLQQWDIAKWKKKINSRVHTLLIPYVIWISLAILIILLAKTERCLLHGKEWSSIPEWLNSHGWLHLYWDCITWNLDNTNIFGRHMPSSSPLLVPFWFIRDLMVVIIFTPVIHWCLTHLKTGFLAVLAICYVMAIWIPLAGCSSCAFFYFSVGAYLMINGLDLSASVRKIGKFSYIVTFSLMPIMIYYNGHFGKIFTLFTISLVISTISIVGGYVARGKGKCLMALSNTSFFVFAAHVMFLPSISNFIHRLTADFGVAGDMIAYLSIPVVTVSICVILCRLLQKYLPGTARLIGCQLR